MFASLSQALVDDNPEEVVIARKEFRKYHDLQNENRSDAILLLKEMANNPNAITQDKIDRALDLVEEHDFNERKSSELHTDLKNLKAFYEVRGFESLNAFLNGIGLPIFILMIGFIFIILYINKETINWDRMTKSFLPASLLCFIISFVYLLWAISPDTDIDHIFYIAGLVAVSIVGAFFVKIVIVNLFRVSYEGFNLKEGIRNIFDMHIKRKTNVFPNEKMK